MFKFTMPRKSSLDNNIKYPFSLENKILMTESAHVSFKINRFAECLDVLPWPSGIRRLCFDPEIVGSRPEGAGTHFFFMHISSVLTFAHGVLFEKKYLTVRFSTKHTMCKSCKWSLG